MRLKIIIGLVLVLAILLGVQTCNVIKTRKTVNRYRDNMESYAELYTNLMNLRKNEIRKYRKDIDSIITSNGIKLKNAVQFDKVIYKNKVVLVPDTFIMELVDTIREPFIYLWDYSENCFNITGQVMDSMIIINKIEYNDQINTIYYKERPHKFLWIRFGRWRYKIKTESECGETFTEKINFVK